MSQLMHLSALVTIDTAFTLYMGKVMGSATDTKLFPNASTLHDLTFKLLSKAERNFVAKSVDENGKWAEVPNGKGSIWNLERTIAIADYCTEHMGDIKIPERYIGIAYNAVINSRQSTKQNPKLLTQIHVIPALLENEHIDDYPVDILHWIDNRFQYVMPPLLKYLKEQGVPVASASDITVAEWQDIIEARFETLDEKRDEATAETGGELSSFSEINAQQTDVDLMAMGGDEHVSLFTSNFEGTYYLSTDENVSEALSAQQILKGYWDLFDTCVSPAQASEAKQSFLNDMSESIKEFKDNINNQQTGAGIVILD